MPSEEDASGEGTSARRMHRVAQRFMAIARETEEAFTEHECIIKAAALAFYGLISLFPLVILLLFIGSNGLAAENASQMLQSSLEQVTPQLAEPLQEMAGQALRAGVLTGVLSALGLLWSASAGFNVLSLGMNEVWHGQPRPFWRRRLLALLTVLVIGALFLLSLGLSALATWDALVDSALPRWGWVNRGMGFIASVALFWVMNRALPNRKVNTRAALCGAALAAVFWEVAKVGFGWFLSTRLARYGLVYGSLASVIVLGIWLFLTAIIIYIGAAIGAALERHIWSGVTEA